MKPTRLLLPLLLLLGGCLDDNLEQLEFVAAHTERPTPLDVGTIQLNGRLDGLNLLQADSCGFVWSEDELSLRALTPGLASIQAAILPEHNGPFNAIFHLKQGQIVFFRAWVALGDRRVYGEVEPYSLDQIIVMTTGSAEVFNDSAAVSGRLAGVELQKTKVRYGHVYSAAGVVPIPTLGLPGCVASEPVETLEDKIFTSGLPGLSFNTTYRVRAYAIGLQDTFYSQTVDTFRIRDGWKRLGTFQNYKKGAATSAGNFGFVGFGCGASTDCFQNQLSRDFFRFDPSGDGGTGSWEPLKAFDKDGFIRSNAVLFGIEDTVYVVFGDFKDANGNLLAVTDFWKYAISSDNWYLGKDIPFIPGQPDPFRTGAVGFVLKGKGYIGTGNYVINQQPTGYRNDFWEYNPGTGNWRKVAGLPIRISDFDTKTYFSGRAEASAFAIGDSVGYAGGGETNGGLQLKDFWKFTPPITDSPSDTGHWELMSFFPGKTRIAAVATTDGKRAWYGLGYNVFEDYLNDWWEFDPAQHTWIERTVFQGTKRADGFGFSIGNKHFIGTGSGKTLNAAGTAFLTRIDADIWLYTPLQ